MSKKIIQLHIYRAPNNEIEVPMVDSEMWLSQKSMALLFGIDVNTVGEHIGNVIEDAGLDKSTSRKFRVVQTEGHREVSRLVNHYNSDAILAVGFRVNSAEAARFRRWASAIINDYLTKGMVVNTTRLESLDAATLERVSEHSLQSIVAAFRKMGDSDEKIRARLNGIVSRIDVTKALKEYVEDRINYGQFTNQTYIGLFRRGADALTLENGGRKPRDGMTAVGLDLLSAAESAVAELLQQRRYLRFFEALLILDKVCRQIAPTVDGLQTLLGVDLGTSQPLLPRGGGSA